jgi:hypothetical protein
MDMSMRLFALPHKIRKKEWKINKYNVVKIH